MKKRRIFGLLALTTLAAVSLASCDDNTVEPEKTGDITETGDSSSNKDNNGGSKVNNKYDVTFDSNCGTTVTTQQVASGSKVSKPTDPTKEQTNTTIYTFKGWYTDNNTFNNEFDFNSAINANVTLYAKWEEAQREYTIKFVDYDDTLINETKYHYNDVVSIPDDPVREGNYYFNGWDSIVTNVNGDMTYKATYSEKQSATITNLSISDKIYDGNPITAPTFDVDSDGDVKIEYITYYDAIKHDDSLYTEEPPSDLGMYYVRITVSESARFAKTVITEYFYIKAENEIVFNLSSLNNIEFIFDEGGYLICVTALDEASQFIINHETYLLGTAQEDVITKYLDDLVNYEFVSASDLSTISFEYSYNDYLNPFKAKIKDYLDNKYNQSTNFETTEFNIDKLKTTFKNYIFEYTSDEVDAMTYDELMTIFTKMRRDTQYFKSVEAKRLYALYMAIAKYKIRVEALRDSVKEDQMADYSYLKNVLPSIYTGTTESLKSNVDSYYAGSVGPCTSSRSAINNFVNAYLGLYDSIINNKDSYDIHKYITYQITYYNVAGARNGIFGSFGGAVGGFTYFLSTYESNKSLIDSLCEANGLDLEALVNNDLNIIEGEAHFFAYGYDYDLWDYVEVTGDKLYYYQSQNTNETYLVTEYKYDKYCFIYDGLIAENDLDNYKPSRYAYCYFSYKDVITVYDYYNQDCIFLTINDDNSVSMNNYIDGDIKYIYNTNNYGSGTVAFVTKDNKNYVYRFMGKHTKEELEAGIAQYAGTYGTWELNNNHILSIDGETIINYVVDHDEYLKEYEIDIENVELLYAAGGEEYEKPITYALVNDNGFNYVLVVYYQKNGKYVSVDYDKVLEVFLDPTSFENAYVVRTNGDLFWEKNDDNVITFLNKAYINNSGNDLEDVTNRYKDVTVKNIFAYDFGEGDKSVGLIKYIDYVGNNRYEVRILDSIDPITILGDMYYDIQSTGEYVENNYTWIETDECFALIELNEFNKGYKEYSVGKVLSLRNPNDDSYKGYIIDIDKDVNKLYSYYDSYYDQTFILFKFKELNLAYVYNGEITDDFKTYVPEKLVTWDYISENSINIDGVYEGKKFAEIVIDENDNLYKVEVDYY